MRSTAWYIRIGSLMPASSGGRTLAQVPEIDVLEKGRIRREHGGDESEATVEEAPEQHVLAHEAPARSCDEVPQRRVATARVQILRSPPRVCTDLLKVMAQVAIGYVPDGSGQRAGAGNGLEVCVHAGFHEASRPREQANVPVAAPAAAPPLPSQVHVLEADAVRWVRRGREHLSKLVPQRTGDPLVGVERQDPLVPRRRDRGIPLTGDRP